MWVFLAVYGLTVFAAGLLVGVALMRLSTTTPKTNKSDGPTETLYTYRAGGRVHKVPHLKGDFVSADCPCSLIPHIKDWCQAKCCQ